MAIWQQPEYSLVRLYHLDNYTAGPLAFKQFGPAARFDHHTPATPALCPVGRAASYWATDLYTTIDEVFGEAGMAEVCPYHRWAFIQPAGPFLGVRLLDVVESAAAAVGAFAKLGSIEDYPLTQEWARAVYEDQPSPPVHGIRYSASHSGGASAVLWETTPELDVLSDFAAHALWQRFQEAASKVGIEATMVESEDCVSCQRNRDITSATAPTVVRTP